MRVSSLFSSLFFFFKQKTAYEMRISDWSSDVCSSDLPTFLADATGRTPGTVFAGLGALDRYEQNAKSTALFTNNTWHATDALDLTLGLRYTRDKKELDAHYSNPNGSPGCAAMLDPVNGQARIAAALMARGVPAAALPQVIPQVIGYGCLPWANPMHVARRDAAGNFIGGETSQSREEKAWSGTLKAQYRWNDSEIGRAHD